MSYSSTYRKAPSRRWSCLLFDCLVGLTRMFALSAFSVPVCHVPRAGVYVRACVCAWLRACVHAGACVKSVKVLHHLSYHMPAPRCVVVARVSQSLERRVPWAGDTYSPWRLPAHHTLGGFCGEWNSDFGSLALLLSLCEDPRCQCKTLWQRNVYVYCPNDGAFLNFLIFEFLLSEMVGTPA